MGTISLMLTNPDQIAQLEIWMGLALDEARAAAAQNEVPVGAVVVDLATGEAIATGRDARIALCDPTAHAEILAMREASKVIGDWRLDHHALIVSLEPCPMCAGAILMARMPWVVYGAANPKFGAIESRAGLYANHTWNHTVQVVSGIRDQEAAEILKEWFRRHRAG